MRRTLRYGTAAFAISAAISLHPAVVHGAPVAFGAADYDNNAAQTTGVFRDVLNGSLINSGLDLGGTGHTALNFTGSDNNDPFKGRTTLYDTNVTDGLQTRFTGNLSMSADILIHPNNNAKGAGLLFLFNEGLGLQGLALQLWDAGNSDSNRIQLVEQTGESRPTLSGSLATTSLGSGVVRDDWYRLTMDLVFTASDFTVTGKVFQHTDVNDPNSALGLQVGTTLTYTAALSSSISNPFEVGLVARGDSAVVDTSVTNFDVVGTRFSDLGASPFDVPEPGTLALLGTGLLGLAASRRRRRS